MSYRDLDINSIEAFLEVVRTGHFGNAAKALGVSQPALSRRVLRLEQALGAALLHRGTARIASAGVGLTVAGEAVRERLAEVLETLESIENELHRRKARAEGSIAVGVVTSLGSYFLPEVLKCLQETQKDIRVQTVEAASGELEGMVENREIDLALVAEKPALANIVASCLWEEEYDLVVSKAMVGEKALPKAYLADLPKVPLALAPSLTLERALQTLDTPPPIATRTDNWETIRKLVESNAAYTILPRCMASLVDWDVKRVSIEERSLRRRVYLLSHASERREAAISFLKSLIVQVAEAQGMGVLS